MRKYLFSLFALLACLVVFGQKSPDPELNKRLEEYLRLNEQLKFDELMEYTHPKIFEIAPKEQLVQIFQSTFENETMAIRFDSTGIINISDAFNLQEASYRKIEYWMVFNIHFKDSSIVYDDAFISNVKASLATGFPDAKLEFNQKTKNFELRASNIMFAIKDNASRPWMFLGYQKNDNGMSASLYPKEVLDHFKL